MSKGWKYSGLIPGETITTNLFDTDKVSPSRVEYIDDFSGGLLLKLHFGPNEERSYSKTVPYAAIHCGEVKIWDQNGKELKIHHEDEVKWEGIL